MDSLLDSILDSIKETSNIELTDLTKDEDLIVKINVVLPTLTILGIGPSEGFSITGSSQTWTDFLGEGNVTNGVKDYVFSKVSSIADPTPPQPTEDSILNTIKSMLGLSIEDHAFDTDVLVHINGTLMTLNQLGVGTSTVFSVLGETETWTDFLGSNLTNLQQVKSFIYIKVKVLFDPPSSSFVIDAMERQAAQFEFRLMIQANPAPALIVEDPSDEDYTY